MFGSWIKGDSASASMAERTARPLARWSSSRALVVRATYLALALALVCGQCDIDIDCSDPEAPGRALQGEGLWAEAAAAFQRAIDRCGDDAGVYSSLGQALWQSGAPDQALPFHPEDWQQHATTYN